MQVSLPPFEVALQAASSATFGELLEVRLRVTSRLGTSERLRLGVALNESFLVTGNTVCSLEVRCRHSLGRSFHSFSSHCFDRFQPEPP